MTTTQEQAAPALLNVKAVAHLLQLSERTIWRMSDAGTLPGRINIGVLVRWRRADLEAWMANGCKSVGAAK